MDRKQAVHQTLLEHSNKPFEDGVLDCCIFVAAAAKKITGIDYSAGFEHHNKMTGEQYLEQHGGLAGLVNFILKKDPVDIDLLEIGDPVLADVPIFGETLALWMGNCAMIKTDVGTMSIPRSRLKKGWNLA